MTNSSRVHLDSYIDLFKRWVDRQLLDRDQPGLSAALIHGQEVIWMGGCGYADINQKVPATENTTYEIGSITKIFTALAILQLRNEGKVDLDREVNEYLPWFEVLPHKNYKDVITVRHLLTHTGGLPPHLVVPSQDSGPTPSLALLKKYLPQIECLVPPGAEARYSNLGYILLGQIIEYVAEMSYAEYTYSKILTPLGMTGTSIGYSATNAHTAAIGYGRRLPQAPREILQPLEMHAAAAAGGMVSTVSDLAKFAMLCFGEHPARTVSILDEKMKLEMFRTNAPSLEGQISQGIAWRLRRVNDLTFAVHGGTVPGFQCAIELCLEKKLGMVVLTNTTDGDAFHFLEKLQSWLGAATENSENNVTLDPPLNSYSLYVGKYRSVWVDIEVFLFQGRLALIHPSAPSPSVMFLDPVGTNVFRINVPLNPESKDLAEFSLNESKQVTMMFLGGVCFNRITRWQG